MDDINDEVYCSQWKLKVTSIEVSGIQLHSGLYWCVYSLSAGLCTYLVVPAYSLHTFQYCELVRVQSDCIFALNGEVGNCRS